MIFRYIKPKLAYFAAIVTIAGSVLGIHALTAYAQSGFMTASGQKLMLNGSQFQGIGFNAGMEGACWSGADWTTAQMDTYFSGLPSNGLTRVFVVQNEGTAIVNSIVTAAAKYNQHLILTLGDDDSNCNDTSGAPSGAGSGKTLAFYQTGWEGAYEQWVNTVVPMFANNTAIAMWEIANEPFHAGATGLTLAQMESYVDGTAALIRHDDPNHLITLGAANTGDFGGEANYQAVFGSTPNLNVLQIHDYAWDYENGAEVSDNFSQEQTAAAADNKPYMQDEAGVEAGNNCTPTPGASNAGLTFSGRVTYLMSKYKDYIRGGSSGVVFWDYETTNFGAACSYEFVPPSDPMIAAVKTTTSTSCPAPGQDVWHAISYAPGFKNQNSITGRYRIDSNNDVQIYATINKTTGNFVSGDRPFTLPSCYDPSNSVFFPVATYGGTSASNTSYLTVDSSGRVTLNNLPSGNVSAIIVSGDYPLGVIGGT